MRRSRKLSGILRACLLLGALLTAAVPAQTEKSAGRQFPTEGAADPFAFGQGDSNASRFSANFSPDRNTGFRAAEIAGFSLKPARARFAFLTEFAAREDFSAFRHSFFKTRGQRRGGGLQALLSTAAGITQIGDARIFENRVPFSSNGQRPLSNYFSVDGLSANLGVSMDETSLAGNAGQLPALTASGGLNSFAPTAQVREMIITTLGAAAEQRVGGADIKIVSRVGGSSSFHGSVFETFGSEKLNANDFFAQKRGFERPAARLNQFGAALGGFIWRNKVWFYGGYDGLRLRQPAFAVSEVPDLFSRENYSGAFGSLLRSLPQPNGRATSNGFAEFAASYTNPATHDVFAARIDAQPFDKMRVAARYNFADSSASLRGDRDFSLNTLRRNQTEIRSLSLHATYVPLSEVVINGRVNFSRNLIGQQFTLDDFGGARPSAEIFSAASVFDFLKFDFAGKNAAIAAGRPLSSEVRQFQAVGLLSWNFNRNQITAGADFRRLALEIGAAPRERNVLFSRAGADLGALTARIVELRRQVSERPETDNFSLFAQDNLRLASRLMVNFGLRWDRDFAPKIRRENVAFQNASLQMPDNRNNFAPRASAAFLPFDSGRSIVRAGFGLYFDFSGGAGSDAFANSFPFAVGAFRRGALWTNAPTDALKPLIVFDNDLRTPRVRHFFVELQQRLWDGYFLTATYTVSAARRLYRTRTLTRADPDYNYIRLTDNSARSDYKSLQLRLERRFSRRVSLNARYTLSKSIDNFSLDALRETNFVAANPETERGASDFDARHQFAFYGAYEIPTFFVGGWARRLAEDWSVSAFAVARSGFPISVGYLRANDFGRQFVRADPVPGAPVYINSDDIKTLNREAFTISGFDRQGDLPRNSLRGFPLFQIDASLQRRIRFSGAMRLELSVAASNLLNRTNFADMSGTLGTLFQDGNFLPNDSFGKATSTFGSANFTPFYLYGGARTIQLSAKFFF